ncbi:MAG: hypothetical protein R3350_08445, partial [Saprospiraceae bacterium]|nr:hypothetical protein [Saprospiraceae bacterium]
MLPVSTAPVFRIIALLYFLLFLSPLTGQEDIPAHKLSPQLKALLDREKNTSLSRTSDPLLLQVLIETRGNAAGTKALIHRQGSRVNSQIGPFLTASIPLKKIPEIARSPLVRLLHYAPPMDPHNELAIHLVKADKVHAGANPLPSSYSG